MFSLKQRSSMRTWWCTCSSQKRHAWILASVDVLCQVLHLSSVVYELLVNIEYGEHLLDYRPLGHTLRVLTARSHSEDLTWHMICVDVVLINSEGSKQVSLFVRQLKRKQACNMMLLPLRQQIIANGKIYWALLAEKLYSTWGTIVVDSNHEKEDMWKYSSVAKCMAWHKTLKWYHKWGWTSKRCLSFKCPDVTQAHLLLVELEELLKLPAVKASSLWQLLEVFHHLPDVQATHFPAILKTQGIKAAREQWPSVVCPSVMLNFLGLTCWSLSWIWSLRTMLTASLVSSGVGKFTPSPWVGAISRRLQRAAYWPSASGLLAKAD